MKVVVSLLSSAVINASAFASTYVAIGDSITSGTHAEPDFVHGVHYSWANGDKLEKSFAKQAGFDVVHNASLPGSLTGIIGYQVSFAKRIKANYVSILAGTNDVCWGVGHKVVANLRQFVEELSAEESVKRIFLGTIPDLEQVYEIGKKYPYCKITAIMCPNYMARGDEYRQGVRQQIKEINAEIIALANDFPKLTVVAQLDTQVYEEADISRVDCFHPSKFGQQKIADAFYEAYKGQ